MRIQLSDASYVHDLASALLHGDCLATPAGHDTLTVMHPSARDDDEAHTEVLFFLRAWQEAHPGVSFRLY
jgi:hypothetical protein